MVYCYYLLLQTFTNYQSSPPGVPEATAHAPATVVAVLSSHVLTAVDWSLTPQEGQYNLHLGHTWLADWCQVAIWILLNFLVLGRRQCAKCTSLVQNSTAICLFVGSINTFHLDKVWRLPLLPSCSRIKTNSWVFSSSQLYAQIPAVRYTNQWLQATLLSKFVEPQGVGNRKHCDVLVRPSIGCIFVNVKTCKQLPWSSRTMFGWSSADRTWTSLETEPDRLCKMSPQAKQFPVLAPPGHNVHCKDQPNETPYHNRPYPRLIFVWRVLPSFLIMPSTCGSISLMSMTCRPMDNQWIILLWIYPLVI